MPEKKSQPIRGISNISDVRKKTTKKKIVLKTAKDFGLPEGLKIDHSDSMYRDFLRNKFIEQAKKYLGVPYAKR